MHYGTKSVDIGICFSKKVKLLEQIGVTPSLVIHADIDEIPQKAERPGEFAKRMALAKALKISIPTG